MENITDIKLIEELASSGALFLLFGGPNCNVCKNLRPRLKALVEEHFPDMHGAYVDCEASPEICAQYGVFSLPVVKVYMEGMLIVEEAGAFSLKQLVQTLERPYSMWTSVRSDSTSSNSNDPLDSE